MSDKTIFVCKPRSISVRTRAELREAGIIVVEMADPNAFKLLKAGYEVEQSDILSSAIQALHSIPQTRGDTATTASLQRDKFVELLSALCIARRP